MSLSKEEVRKVAKLARLALTEAEEEQYAKQLSAILEAVAQLDALDTKNVEPTSHATLSDATWRKDERKPSLPADLALGNAPQRVGTSFAVPKIIE